MYEGEYGSAVPVSAKQRPQASPAPRPEADPKASWEMAAVKPEAGMPQAGGEEEERRLIRLTRILLEDDGGGHIPG